MFLDLFDTIKTAENHYTLNTCKMNAIQGESMLYNLLLTGQTPTLTQTQAMDSAIIHNILRSEQSKAPFLKMLQTGKIKLALYTGTGARSLQDYYKKSLMYGIEKDTDFFDFSTMPFLSQYDSKTRSILNENIIDALEHNSYNFTTDGVNPEHIDYISSIIENIQDIDRAVRGGYIASNVFKHNIDDLFQTQCQGIIKSDNINTEFVKLCQHMLNKEDYQNRRSIYYNYLGTMGNYYTDENIEKMRQVIDNCYNVAVASSIEDDGYTLNIPSKHADLIQPIEQNGDLIKKEIIELKPSKADKYLTWEALSNIMMEVEVIEKKKKLSRMDALLEYKRVQSYKPIISVVKYLGISTITSFIPGVPQIVEILSDIISGTASDMVGEKLKKPSLGEVVTSFKGAKNKTRTVEDAIEFISITMQ